MYSGSKVADRTGTPVFPDSPDHESDLGHVLEVQGPNAHPEVSIWPVWSGAEDLLWPRGLGGSQGQAHLGTVLGRISLRGSQP